MKVFKEFKQFALRGNVMDLAVGIIIGAAFGKIISSLVSDILMPPLGLLVGGIDFKDIAIILRGPETDAAGKIIQEAVTLKIGNFIQTIVDFLIVAFTIFMLVKGMNNLSKKKEAEQIPVPGPTKDQELLTEIRDLLKK